MKLDYITFELLHFDMIQGCTFCAFLSSTPLNIVFKMHSIEHMCLYGSFRLLGKSLCIVSDLFVEADIQSRINYANLFLCVCVKRLLMLHITICSSSDPGFF